MKFCIVGTGGVGGYFGGKLANAGSEVWFIARGAHLQALRGRGLHIHATDEDFVIPPGRMTDRPEDAGVCDVVLVCVKAYDTESAARMIAPVVGKGTLVISLQNGIENETTLRSVLREGTVYGGIAYIYATMTAPGEISETGGPKKIVFGPMEAGTTDPRGEEILAVMSAAGITATFSMDIRTELWKKFVFISAIGGVTALTRLTLGELLTVKETCTMLEEAMQEGVAVAGSMGVVLDPSLIPGMFETLHRFDNRSRSSMYYDLTHGKPLEIEAFSGTIVRLGLLHAVPTPVHRMLYATLLPHHLLHRHLSTQQPSARNTP
jgi:2-dehydropantoate 2-reductase